MKLFTKYSRVNLVATIMVLVAGSICYYFIVRYTLLRQLDNTLKVEEAEIIDFVKNKGQLPEPTNYKDQLIRFKSTEFPVRRRFRSISLYDQAEKEKDLYRTLIFPISVQGQNYEVSVSKSQAEKEDLLVLIVIITIGVVILLLLLQFLANRFLLRKIWHPFYGTLGSLWEFNLTKKQPVPYHPSDIDEFNELDNAVHQMTDKIFQDYETLKNFADNASHEMQTPLAIINSKLDLLIQDQNLEEKHVKQLQAMYDAVGRLSKLNQSLLLLTKIENNQFIHIERIGLSELVDEKLIQLEELVEARKLKLAFDKHDTVVQMNSYLADILLNNLLINAIRYNVEKGSIRISLTANQIKVVNTGTPLAFQPDTIFDRFKKGNYSDGTGLGLAIVKQICDKYNFGLSYHFEEPLHIFTVRF